jgi:hypothetical protein
MTARDDEYGNVPETIPARDVEEGDFLPGLDMGYVFDVDVDEQIRTFTAGEVNILMGEFTVITFHDQDGDENYLILKGDVPVTVERRVRR